MGEKKAGNSIYFWRIIFTYVIAFFHFDNIYKISDETWLADSGYLGVEFFFIVSGFILFSKFDSDYQNRFSSNWHYIWHRIKRIYPDYIIVFLVSVIFSAGVLKPVNCLMTIINNFWEVFLLHGIGLNKNWGYVNPLAWYITVLLVMEFLVFFLLQNHRKLLEQVIAPMAIIIGFSVLYRRFGWIGAVEETDGVGVPYSMIRGGCAISLGILAAKLNQALKGYHAQHRGIFRAVSCVCFLGVLYIILLHGYSDADFLAALLLTVGVAFGFFPTENKFIYNPIIKYLSAISLDIYLLNELFRMHIIPGIFGVSGYSVGQRYMIAGVYLVMLTVGAILLNCLVRFVVVPCARLIRSTIVSSQDKSGNCNHQ